MPEGLETGKRMSLYGKSELTPEERDGLWKNVLERVENIRRKHLATTGDGSRNWRGIKTWSRQELEDGKTTFCGPRIRNTVADVSTNYSRLFHLKYDYDNRIHRDDRQSIPRIGRAVQQEESERAVPVLSSSVYGSRVRKTLEPFSRNHVRIQYIAKEFYQTHGTGLSPTDQ